ncbi:polysaccharide lyase family 8 super-sandwich domain-containing protein [Vibrio hepatarius]|uniref:polysaccharide lyase family 8 super-sandwich domain-containing protein n=1 Tax=Vibrio hepatarius TaxID=171383 RepID=UPI00142D29C5|nr:polysaccharide lyase family 8 super-sandwich domain-containing protein [Vibrio hepatarius]NIY82379.1 DNRLRE domain-containing protein [Vibrio hepatarius]
MRKSKLSLLTVSVLIAVGCHDDNTSKHGDETVDRRTYQAKVIDGYLRGAQVWLDVNQNFQLDEGEPTALSQEGGYVELDVTSLAGNPQDYPLVTRVIKHQTIDEDHGEVLRKSYLMVAPEGINNVTPLTHLLYSKQRAEGLTLEEAKSQVAALVNMSDEDALVQDYLRENQQQLHAFARSFTVVLSDSGTQPTQHDLNKASQTLESVAKAINQFIKSESGPIDYQAIQLRSIAENEEVLADPQMLVKLISMRDTDGDGITDGLDDDDDNDGVSDDQDAFPLNTHESKDSDGDGIGDNSDAFPFDASNQEQVIVDAFEKELKEQVENAQWLKNQAKRQQEQAHREKLALETQLDIQVLTVQNEINQLNDEIAAESSEEKAQYLQNRVNKLADKIQQLNEDFNATVSPVNAKLNQATKLLAVSERIENKVSDQKEKIENTYNIQVAIDTPATSDVQTDQPSTAASDFEKLQQRIVPDFITQEAKRSAKSGKSTLAQANEYIAQQLEDGSWPGIDYASQGRDFWAPSQHLDYMRKIAVAYASTGLEIYKTATLKALTHWFDVKPTSQWWWEQIGKPRYLGTVALLLGEALPESMKEQVSTIMPTEPNTEKTGANRTDISLCVLYNGLLLQDSTIVGAALKDIENTIEVTTEEGIQPDWSFHQHGAQLYTGGYGEVFLNPVLLWAYNVHDLQWKFSSDKIDKLAGLLLDGMRWMSRSGQLDYNVLGRGISRPKTELSELGNPTDKVQVLTNMDMIAALVPERADEALAYKQHVYFGAPSGLNGFRHYWRSDYSVAATDNFMFGIKMNSKRMSPSENGNGENLLGYWLGFGSTFLMQSGKEYYNIFPVWDWRKLPGVTSPEYQEAPGYWGSPMQDVTFVGGVSNGAVGVATMDMDMDVTHLERIESNWRLERGKRIPLSDAGGNTKAKKSWFSFGGEIVALGAGISSTHRENVNTTLNQTLLNGDVTIGNGQRVVAMGEHDVASSSWVHHDGVGYVFLDASERSLTNKTQSGRWSLIKSGESDDVINKDVFTLVIPHGVKPTDASYEYIIAPGKTAQQTAEYQQNLPVRVLQNTSEIQAVEHTLKSTVGIVFHQAGMLTLSPELSVKVDKPSVVLLDRSGAELVVTVSTPGQPYSVVNLTVIKQGVSTTQKLITPGSAAQMGNSVQFVFSQGQDVTKLNDSIAVAVLDGGALTDQATIEGAEKLNAGLTIKPTEDAFVQGGASAPNNYGSSGYMQLKNGTGVYDRRSLLRFDLSQIGQNKVANATLRLYIRGVKTEGVDRLIAARLVEGGAWSESTLTYRNFPDLTMRAQSDVTRVTEADKGTWIELNIADAINTATSMNNLVLELVDLGADQGANFISFATKEYGSNGPQLILQGVANGATDADNSSESDSNDASNGSGAQGGNNSMESGGSTTEDSADGTTSDTVDNEKKAAAERALANELELTVIQDSRVEGGANADKNFGTSGYMTVKNGPGKYDRRSVLRFDLSSLAGASVTAAKLRVYANVIDLKTLSSASLQAVELDNYDWNERLLSWNALPDVTTARTSPIATVTKSINNDEVGVDRWVEVDVTDLINANTGKPYLDLLLRNPNASDQITYFSFATKEKADGANAAQLVMTNKASGFLPSETLATYQGALKNWQTHLVGTAELASDPNAQAIIDKHLLSGKTAWQSIAPKSEWHSALWSDLTLAGARDGRAIKDTFRRLKQMAIAYHMPGELKGSVELKQTLIDALNTMLTTHFTTGMTHLGNWHEWEIGVPMLLNDILVLMRDELSSEMMQTAIEVSRYMLPDPRYQYGSQGSRGSQFSNTGGNRADTVLITLIRGLLDHKKDEVDLALAALPPVLKEVTRGDGFYRDGSFIQHVDIPYTGTYGGVVISGVSKVMFVLQGADILPEELKQVTGLVEKAYEPLLFRGQMPDMMNGRAIARGWSQSSGEGAALLRSLLRLYPAIQGEPQKRLGALLKHHLQNNRTQSSYGVATDLVYVPIINQILADDTLLARGELEGNFLFHNMDRVVHRKANYLFGIAAHSNRTGNYEAGSRGENAKGWYTGDGMTYLYDADLEQHYNHWPLMDMARLPGTTSDTRVLAGSGGRRSAYSGGRKTNMDWVGGASNQKAGTFGMDFHNWDDSLRAKKSWFMFDDEILAIGSNIQGERLAQTVTGLDARKLNEQGDNVIMVDGKVFTDGAVPQSTIHIEGNTSGSQLGIVLPYEQAVSLERSYQTGDWAEPYTLNSSKMDNTQVQGWRLLSTIGHSVVNNHYAYVLLPQKSAAQTAQYATEPEVTILHQNGQIHAVAESGSGMYAANVWVSEEVTTPELVVRGQVSLLTRKQNGQLHIWIAQPTRDANSVEVKFPLFDGSQIISDDEQRIQWQDGFFKVSTDNLAGASYHFVIAK